MIFSSNLLSGKNEVEMVKEPTITGIIISKNGIDVSYSLFYDKDVNVSINGKGIYKNSSVDFRLDLKKEYNEFHIDANLDDILPEIFQGITVYMMGNIKVNHNEKSYKKEFSFNVSYTKKASLNFTTHYYKMDNNTETETLCKLHIPFLLYNGNVSLYYDTYFELIQHEMNISQFPNNGITDGFKKINEYNNTNVFNQNYVVYSGDYIVYDLSKAYYYKEIPNDVKDLCGQYLDFRVAINLDQENNTAPDPIYYFKNIVININETKIYVDDHQIIIQK